VTSNTVYSVATTASDGSIVIEVNSAPTAPTTTLLRSRTTYSCTNGMQTFTAPVGVTSINAVLVGGSGGLGGGFGGVVKTTMRVTPGATYYVVVGCQGQTNRGGYNVRNSGLDFCENCFPLICHQCGDVQGGGEGTGGFNNDNTPPHGGGGGATDIRTGTSIYTRLVVAGGGGGCVIPCDSTQPAGYWGNGGGAGKPNIENGGTGWYTSGGGTLTSGGRSLGDCACSVWVAPGGDIFAGGNGVSAWSCRGGGGGGGYYGGAGGCNHGGGGGSSFRNTSVCSATTFNVSTARGDGYAIISYTQLLFGYTGAPQTFVAPADVSAVYVMLKGASGGNDNSNMSSSGSNHVYGGKGGVLSATLSVTPGATYSVYVGGAGASWWRSSGAIAGGFNVRSGPPPQSLVTSYQCPFMIITVGRRLPCRICTARRRWWRCHGHTRWYIVDHTSRSSRWGWGCEHYLSIERRRWWGTSWGQRAGRQQQRKLLVARRWRQSNCRWPAPEHLLLSRQPRSEGEYRMERITRWFDRHLCVRRRSNNTLDNAILRRLHRFLGHRWSVRFAAMGANHAPLQFYDVFVYYFQQPWAGYISGPKSQRLVRSR